MKEGITRSREQVPRRQLRRSETASHLVLDDRLDASLKN